jgi:hypothetical protein
MAVFLFIFHFIYLFFLLEEDQKLVTHGNAIVRFLRFRCVFLCPKRIDQSELSGCCDFQPKNVFVCPIRSDKLSLSSLTGVPSFLDIFANACLTECDGSGCTTTTSTVTKLPLTSSWNYKTFCYPIFEIVS